MTVEQNTVELVNGAAQKGDVVVVDVSHKEKADMEKNLEVLRNKILDLSKRYEKAFTADEKQFIVNRLKLLEYNYKVLRNTYDQRYDLTDLKDIAVNSLQTTNYDVDDPQVRKRIGYQLSYNSGKSEYTDREVNELKKLIPDIDGPIVIRKKKAKK